jgi:hypothetical protein
VEEEGTLNSISLLILIINKKERVLLEPFQTATIKEQKYAAQRNQSPECISKQKSKEKSSSVP